ncbi:MAG: hypothetical protein NTZ51_07650 [Proteobacteria bacterium]|nr:hypothetical protein [Pseudomonadota bacterium]
MHKNRRKESVKGTGTLKTYQQDRRVILKFVPKLRKVKKGSR